MARCGRAAGAGRRIGGARRVLDRWGQTSDDDHLWQAPRSAGFFASHSVASSWVGRRAAGSAGQASALYLLAYYTGASIAGPLAGTAWTMDHWNGVLAIAGLMLTSALLVSLRQRRTPPLAVAPAA